MAMCSAQSQSNASSSTVLQYCETSKQTSLNFRAHWRVLFPPTQLFVTDILTLKPNLTLYELKNMLFQIVGTLGCLTFSLIH